MPTVRLDRRTLLAGVILRSRYLGIRNNEHRSHCAGSLRHLRRNWSQDQDLSPVLISASCGCQRDDRPRPADWAGRQPGRIPPPRARLPVSVGTLLEGPRRQQQGTSPWRIGSGNG